LSIVANVGVHAVLWRKHHKDFGKALSNQEIAKAIADHEGYGAAAVPALALRVRGNLTYQLQRAMVSKTGDRLTARWRLAI